MYAAITLYIVSSNGRSNRFYLMKHCALCGVCIVPIKGSSSMCMHVQACLFCWSVLSRPWRSIIKTSARTADSMEVQDLSGPGNTTIPGLLQRHTVHIDSVSPGLLLIFRDKDRTKDKQRFSVLLSFLTFSLTLYYFFSLLNTVCFYDCCILKYLTEPT